MLEKSEEEWKKTLSEEAYEVLRKKGTERPFTGKYNDFFEEGTYYCAACETKLFTHEGKFDSHCGWPAFHTPAVDSNIKYEMDESHGMKRVEIICANCGGHLGHVFNDGPVGKGYRYCVNSLSLDFKKDQ
ncbi:MAG: peptide-methionine (R)-S-oxide reductase MsrB [Bacteroidota bacterium]